MLAKNLQAAVAGQSFGGPTYVEDVFSTYLYTGNGATHTIRNGINLGDNINTGSVYFDGSGDYLETASSISLGTGDFTVETYVYVPSSSFANIFNINDDTTSSGFTVYTRSTGNFTFFSNGSSTTVGSGGEFTFGEWQHVTITRSGTTVTIYVDGVSVGSVSGVSNDYSGVVRINAEYYSGTLYPGPEAYFSNYRLSSVARTVAVPTNIYSNDANTVLLTLQGSFSFADNSSNGYAIVKYGNVAASEFGLTFTSDVAGEGGLVFIKDRTNGGTAWSWVDTARGIYQTLESQNTGSQTSRTTGITAFNSTGFTMGSYFDMNTSARDYASWTFRKAPKFFDVVTYTGNGVDNRTISTNLDMGPGYLGAVIIKRLDTTSNWKVTVKAGSQQPWLALNLTSGDASTAWTGGNISLSINQFTLTAYDGNMSAVNADGGSYVAYVFAHNAGGFGDSGEENVISCGSYTGTGSADGSMSGPQINLGWEPQFVIIKKTSDTSNWFIFDNMRGIVSQGSSLYDGSDAFLSANDSGAEYADLAMFLTPTGFQIDSGSTYLNASGGTYIYIAIRRGPMKTPESGAEVFAIDTRTTGNPSYSSGFPVDMGWKRTVNTGSGTYVASRLTGTGFLYTNSTASESTDPGFVFDYMDGWAEDGLTNSNVYSWMFRRAPGFFDVVNSTGAGGTVYHNLGVTPELIIAKVRDYSPQGWYVYAPILGSTPNLYLHSTQAAESGNISASSPTSTQFTTALGGGSYNYIYYLFASCPGVSKVGSYTGNANSNGDSQTIDCGFSNGARFVLIKRTDNTGNWWVFDTSRGIVSGNDPILYLNTTAAEDSTQDVVDPVSSGFAVVQQSDYDINAFGATYIYLAIA